MANKVSNEESAEPVGRIVLLVLSLILAGFLTKKLVDKYPQGNMKTLVPGTLAIFADIFIIMGYINYAN